MIGEKARTRQQGIEEQTKQALVRDRMSHNLKQTIEKQQLKEVRTQSINNILDEAKK